MQIRRNPDSGRQAVTLLASAFVVLIGGVSTAFTLLAMADQQGWRPWAVWAMLFTGVVLILTSLYRGPEGGVVSRRLFWVLGREKADPAADYVFRKRFREIQGELGKNGPPTLESVREAAESNMHWVPRGSRPDRDRSRSQPNAN